MVDQNLVPHERVERSILILRGHRVILDSDLAALYGVETRRLNEQVKRSIDRFPDDFAFTLTEEDNEVLRSQFATLKTGRGEHRKYPPRAFTEQGALMAASVLSSAKAVEMSIFVVRVCASPPDSGQQQATRCQAERARAEDRSPRQEYRGPVPSRA